VAENRLGAATSAYLQSAAHQPIHWFPWSAEAFAAAEDASRPMLLDIGAVWCHWCHVMDRESYEDPALAAFLNDNFVCVKVDRDERPDVDARYQRAVQTMTGQGGWPLTAFLTPAGQVFYGGTYFPPDGRMARPGFRSVLEQVLRAFHDRRDQVDAQALAIRRLVDQQLDDAAPGDPRAALLDDAMAQMARAFDPTNGGFGGQPKFPHPGAVALLLARQHDAPSDDVRRMIDVTLTHMARGGVYDQLGGGFHRYSVDAEWVVPHFEKMSYDNSELLRVYCDAFAALGDPLYAEAARGIVRWVRDVLADPEGGYGASQDADVGLDDDGDYFTWTRDEVAAVLDADELAVATAYWNIGTAGEMHHNPAKNVLFVAVTPMAAGAVAGVTGIRAAALIASAARKLLAARGTRTAPFVDRTRYAAWNAMLASALLRAGAVLDDQWATEHALRTLARLRAECPELDAVPHTPGGVGGLLDDQVQTALAALDAAEATGDEGWAGWAAAILERVWRDYAAEDGALYDTATGRGGEGLLPMRARTIQDAPTPAPNGAAALAALRLHERTGDARWRARADGILTAFAGSVSQLGLFAATYLLALDRGLHPVAHVVVVGAPGDRDAEAMQRVARAAALPRRSIRRLAPGASAAALPPELAGMLASARGATGFLCIGDRCLAPARDVAAWRAALSP